MYLFFVCISCQRRLTVWHSTVTLFIILLYGHWWSLSYVYYMKIYMLNTTLKPETIHYINSISVV